MTRIGKRGKCELEDCEGTSLLWGKIDHEGKTIWICVDCYRKLLDRYYGKN